MIKAKALTAATIVGALFVPGPAAGAFAALALYLMMRNAPASAAPFGLFNR